MIPTCEGNTISDVGKYIMQPIFKSFTIRNGETIKLRPPQRTDLDELLRYANELSQEDTYVILSGETLTRDEEIRYLDQVIYEMEQNNRIHLFAFAGQKLIGNADIHKITRFRTRAMHVGEVAISVAKNYRGLGLGKILLETLISEVRNQGYRLLILDVFAENERAIALYKSIGFQFTGERPGGILYKGRYIGQILMHLSLV